MEKQSKVITILVEESEERSKVSITGNIDEQEANDIIVAVAGSILSKEESEGVDQEPQEG